MPSFIKSPPTDSLARHCKSWRRPSVKRLRLFELLTDYACHKGIGKKKERKFSLCKAQEGAAAIVNSLERSSHCQHTTIAEHLGASYSSRFLRSCACTPRMPLFSPPAKLPRLAASKPLTQRVWALFRRHGEAECGGQGQRWLH